MNQVQVKKAKGTWHVMGLVGMSDHEFNSVAEQLLAMPDLTGDVVLVLHTKQGTERWSSAELTSDSARALLVNNKL